MALTWVKIANLKGPKGNTGPQGGLGDQVIGLDTDGTPYYTTTAATLRIFPDTDGNPYYADDPWPTVTTDTDGVPYLTY